MFYEAFLVVYASVCAQMPDFTAGNLAKMFYRYTDSLFRGKTIRLINADEGTPGLSDDLIAVLRLTHEEQPNVIAVLKHNQHIYQSFRNRAERDVWDAYLVEYPLLYDDNYKWTRTVAEV